MEDPLAELVQEMLRLLATSPGLAVGAPLRPELRRLEHQARRIVEYAQRRDSILQHDCRAQANDPVSGPRAAALLVVSGAINAGLEQGATIADRYLMEARHLGSGALFMGAHTAATQIGVSIRDLKQSYAGGVTPARRT